MSTERCPYTLNLKKYLYSSNDGKKFKLKHLFFAENPLDVEGEINVLNYFYYPEGNRTNYFTAVYVGLEFENTGSNKSEQLEALRKAGVLVWDIFHHKGEHNKEGELCDNKCNAIQAGHKITSVDRTKMIQEGCSLHAFQSSVQALNELDIEVDENLSIYFMMPQLTSLPIFNHYNCPEVKSLEIANKDFIEIIREPNPLFTQDIYFIKEIFPRHMINVIGGSNTPRANLVKHARDCQDRMHKMKPNQK